ncbi:MAG: ribosome-binding factor A, partial [Bacteroidales bacterium]
MMESTRQQKVSRMLQRELGLYFQQHATEILPGKLITVTVVRVSPDLGVAKVYLSIFPLNKKEEPLENIRSRASAIRNQIGQIIKNQVRSIPEFIY